MSKRVVLLPGDGIGPEVLYPAVEVLETLTPEIEFEDYLFGGASIESYGVPLADETLAACREADAVLLGAVGGPQWDPVNSQRNLYPTPEEGLLELRKELNLYANLRPVVAHPQLYDASPLKNERVAGASFMIVRELTGGIYYGSKDRVGDKAIDVCEYTQLEVERVAQVAFMLADIHHGKVTSVDKANVLETSKLWRETVSQVGKDYDVELEHMLADTAFARLISRPTDFDVVLTDNLFGDLLSDAAAPIAGSLGLMPSMSIGRGSSDLTILCEPIHGSAPDIVGQNKANPIGMFRAAGLMLNRLDMNDEATVLEAAVDRTITDGIWTPDLLEGTATTQDVTRSVLKYL